MKKGQNFNHPVKGSKIRIEPIRKKKDIRAVRKLLSDNPRNLAMFNLGITTSLRPLELLDLRYGQIHQCNSPDIMLEVKNNGCTEKNFLDPECVKSIKDLLAFRRKEEGRILDDIHLFKGLRGPMRMSSLNNLVKNSIKKKYGDHLFRHCTNRKT